MSQTSAPQIYGMSFFQILKSVSNSQIYVLFQILKSAFILQTYDRFSHSQIDIQWHHWCLLQMMPQLFFGGFWNNNGEASRPDSRWGILDDKKKRSQQRSKCRNILGSQILWIIPGTLTFCIHLMYCESTFLCRYQFSWFG